MQAGIKKHRYKNGAVQKPSFIFPPFQAREAQAFLSVPSRLFSPPSACHGLSLGKAARRELTFNAGYYIRGSPACQVQCIRGSLRLKLIENAEIMTLMKL
jgi:hypothetical protein